MSGPDERAAIVARARAVLGAPFRLHGRCPKRGIDCVGLVAIALGREDGAPELYGLRMGDVNRARAWAGAAGFREVATAEPGDVLLVRPGPLQLHLALCVPGGFVHAHAGLRHVVETPGPLPWPVIACWRG